MIIVHQRQLDTPDKALDQYSLQQSPAHIKYYASIHTLATKQCCYIFCYFSTEKKVVILDTSN